MREAYKTADQLMREKTFAGKRILLVEDNAINMEFAEAFLRMLEIQVEKAWNGREALEQYFGSPIGYYDMVLMDINMPVMNGLEAIKKIREKERQRTPIIAYTSETSPEDLEIYKSTDMDGWLGKPASLSDICQILQRWL